MKKHADVEEEAERRSTFLTASVSIREEEEARDKTGRKSSTDRASDNLRLLLRLSSHWLADWFDLGGAAAAAHLAPVELWVMEPEFTNREINTWLPGKGNKASFPLS